MQICNDFEVKADAVVDLYNQVKELLDLFENVVEIKHALSDHRPTYQAVMLCATNAAQPEHADNLDLSIPAAATQIVEVRPLSTCSAGVTAVHVCCRTVIACSRQLLLRVMRPV